MVNKTKFPLLFVSFLFWACASVPPYDPATDQTITQMESMVTSFYETMATGNFDEAKYALVRGELKTWKMKEKEKGEGNRYFIAQIDNILDMLDYHVQYFKKSPSGFQIVGNFLINSEKELFKILKDTERRKRGGPDYGRN